MQFLNIQPLVQLISYPTGATPREGCQPRGEGAAEVGEEGAGAGAGDAGHAAHHLQAPEGDGRQGGRPQGPRQARGVAARGHRGRRE